MIDRVRQYVVSVALLFVFCGGCNYETAVNPSGTDQATAALAKATGNRVKASVGDSSSVTIWWPYGTRSAQVIAEMEEWAEAIEQAKSKPSPEGYHSAPENETLR